MLEAEPCFVCDETGLVRKAHTDRVGAIWVVKVGSLTILACSM
jgi:hypothetical protein